MKFQITDSKDREAVKRLFNRDTFDLPVGDLWNVSITIRCGENSAEVCIPLDPIREFAEGWHPYPEEKPKEVAQFLVARKRDDSSAKDFGIAHWGGGFFYPVDSDIFAWREIPKIWK